MKESLMQKREYRVIKRGDKYSLVLLVPHLNFVEIVNINNFTKNSFEDLRSEVIKTTEAFGKPVIKGEIDVE